MRLRFASLVLALLVVLVPKAHAGFVGVGANPLSGGSGTSVVVTAPTVLTGDKNCIMYALIGKSNNSAVSSSGWTNHLQCTASSQSVDYLWRATSGSEGGTYTFSWSTTSSQLNWAQIMLFCGEVTSGPIDSASCVNHSSSTSNATPSITPAAADEDGVVSYGTINAGVATWPTGPVQIGVDGINGTILGVGFLIGNASAQQYTLTSSNPGNSFGEMTFFNRATNDRTWGIRSVSSAGSSGSTAVFNAPVNIGAAREKIDLFLEVPTHNTVTGPTHWTCADSVQYSGGTDTFWHCVDSAPSSSDTTYSFNLGGSATNWGGYMFDQINVTATDAVAMRTTGAATSSTTNTLTTANNGEPIFSAFKQQNVASSNNQNPPGTILITPLLNQTTLDFGWNISFERQATAGTSTARTATCHSSCSSGNTWGNSAVANVMATPVPANGGGGQGQGQGQGQGSRGNIHPPHGGGRAGSGSAWRPRWAGGY